MTSVLIDDQIGLLEKLSNNVIKKARDSGVHGDDDLCILISEELNKLVDVYEMAGNFFVDKSNKKVVGFVISLDPLGDLIIRYMSEIDLPPKERNNA